MIALFLLLALPHVGGEPGPWQTVTGVNKVQYRWSRPASNTCLVEFENQDIDQPAQFMAVATFAYTRPTKPVVTKSLAPKKDSPTVVKEKTIDRQLPVHIFRSGTYSTTIDSCYHVTLITASAPSSNDATETVQPPTER